jgi:hypothetical protein
MSQVVAHPLRIVAIMIGLACAMAAGTMQERAASSRATTPDGWITATVDVVDIDQDARLAAGRDAFAVPAYAKQLEQRYADASEQVERAARDEQLSDETALVAYAAHRYLEHSEQLYRTASIHQDGFPASSRTDGYFQDQFEKRAQLRADLHAALKAAGHDSLALRVTPPPGVTPKLPAAEDAQTELMLELM